jgi:hypothetical protein
MLVMYSLFTLLDVLTISSKRLLTHATGRVGGALAVSVVLLTETAIDELITATADLGELCDAAEVGDLPWPEGGG